MTAAVYIDPVVGAAVVHLGQRIIPALPCPTWGRGSWPGRVHEGRALDVPPCPSCGPDGVWLPPDSPVPICVTSAEPHLTAEQFWAFGAAGYADETGLTVPIVTKSVVGEATLRKLPVVGYWIGSECIVVHGDGTADHCAPFDDVPGQGYIAGQPLITDISSALPFLPDLKPDDTVYLLDGFTTSVREPMTYQGAASVHYRSVCCPFPVDAPDHPCVQEET